ncbi:[protein-PII] uridylyltransferase [Crateriforma conspicua]|uniref:Bifunctional uridylyltransferase/uridylyl-removing enzyme n=1 Tax=Crateriforma conspicua TaxID=2527996 RepID=A0A5C5Y917_9PLAN|nr:[protein-PII] uridylyltransferase [Crateriforma conspicua]QDV65550.1 Bifunctional uridylyltransferase/uridylyl-removing enzyme [Crateriforma conspicua]TWT70941.1 Bifunctional uridylyltransferase/uridylyl-removing enzyme [Crateriforma conspicua]
MSFQPVVLAARERLAQVREKIRGQHADGSPGFQVANRMADLYDDVVLMVWESASRKLQHDLGFRGLALVAHGGFGRRDLAPFSDVDLMLLTTARSAGLATEVAGILTRDLVDAGLDLGFSIRGPAEACKRAWTDPVIFSSLAESRFLAGSSTVFGQYFDRLRKGSIRRQYRLTKTVVEARRSERLKWGETNYLLRPNVKKSRGALRDIQLVRWIGFARSGESDLEKLYRLGALPAEDLRQLRHAYAFMLRLRNELHFRAGRSQDVLDRATQMEIAEQWGYENSEGVLAVEHFMQDYFEHTQNVRYAAAYFTDDTLSQSRLSRVSERALSRKLTENIRMGPTQIWVVDSDLDRFATSLPDVLRLMNLANQHFKRISHRTWQAIRHSMARRNPSPPDPDSINAFLGLLSKPGRLASLLRRLHELRVLEQLIPPMKRCRGLLQFNAYHKYTVDAHCIRAVEAATKLEEYSSSMARRYARLKDKAILHLALLIHDLGKGYEEDHCEVGRRIAGEIADHLELDDASRETLQWLVHKHLIVNVAAFRHDLNDSQVVLSFAAEVGSIRRLELLIVHAVADLIAVGPGVASDWKMNLIEDLYLRTRRYFESGTLPDEMDAETASQRKQIAEQLADSGAPKIGLDILNALPLSILRRITPDQLVGELTGIAQWYETGRSSCCVANYDSSFLAMRYTVLHREARRNIGTFARSTGALSGLGLQIMRADVDTIEVDDQEVAWDSFWVLDPDHENPPPQHRVNEVCNHVCRLLADPTAPVTAHRDTWRGASIREPDSVNVLPTKVTFDNDTLEQYTILSLFAYDRQGLLYRVARAMAELSIVLHFAKIDTHLDQIADVFYVTESDGNKIVDSTRQKVVQQSILESLEMAGRRV